MTSGGSEFPSNRSLSKTAIDGNRLQRKSGPFPRRKCSLATCSPTMFLGLIEPVYVWRIDE